MEGRRQAPLPQDIQADQGKIQQLYAMIKNNLSSQCISEFKKCQYIFIL